MNYLDWSEKLYKHFFNDDNKNQEVVLYTDKNLFDQLFGEEGGEKDFISIFDPQKILSNCYPQPQNRFAIRNQITSFNEFISLEHLLNYLIENPQASFKICKQNLKSSDPLSYFPFIILVIYAYSTEYGI